MIIHLDFETRSAIELKNGPAVYFAHPSTEVLCLAYQYEGDEEVRLLTREDFATTGSFFDGHYLVAHNALFEFHALRWMADTYGWVEPDISKMVCTMALACHASLPPSLDKAAEVLGLKQRKDDEGSKVMKKMCKPQRGKWVEDGESLQRLYTYCKQDVRVEAELYHRLPKLSSPLLKEMWYKHAEICLRGFPVDLGFASQLEAMVAKSREFYSAQVEKSGQGIVTGADMRRRDFLLDWLKANGITTECLRADDVQRILKQAIPDEVRDVLEARAQLSKASTAKLVRFADSAVKGRVHDGYMFHGAITGRFSGRGVQPQNFPKTSDTLPYYVAAIEEQDFNSLLFASTTMTPAGLTAQPMKAISECLRSVIAAPSGKQLMVADYAAVEARGVLWFANDPTGMKVFSDFDSGKGIEPYCWMGEKIFGHPVTKKDKEERQLAKFCVLGAGFSMSGKQKFDRKTQTWLPSKFKLTCEKYGAKISDELAEQAIDAYRTSFPRVVASWAACEKAAREAINTPNLPVKVHGTQPVTYTYVSKTKCLLCRLPSGRVLTYRDAEIGEMVYTDEDGYTERKAGVTYYRWSSMKKKWQKALIYAGHFVENIVQGFCADLLFGAMCRLDNKTFPIVMHSHDEVIAEVDAHIDLEALRAEYITQLTTLPDWAAGLPLKAEGWYGTRYKKA